VGSCGGSFYALEVPSGAVAWKYDTSVEGLRSTFHADPVVVGDLVLTAADGSPDSHLYAFEAPTGRLRWKFPVPPRGISTGLVANADTVFGVTLGGQVIALALADGARRWTFELPAGLRDRRGQVYLRGDQLVVVEPDGSVFALAASTGREIWRQNLGEPVHPVVAAVGARLLVPTAGGDGLQLSPQTGSVERRGPLGDGPVLGGLVPADSCLVLAIGPRTLLCADPASGRARWKFTTGADVSSLRPLVRDGEVWVGDESGRLTAVSLATGSETRFLFVPGIPRGLANAGSWLIVGTMNGLVVGFEVSANPEAAPRAARSGTPPAG
jgi:outer membrane protein assembly factor BamB